MGKFIKAVLVFLFYWAVVGTGIAVILSLIGLNKIFYVGPLVGIAYGIYSAVGIIRTKSSLGESTTDV